MRRSKTALMGLVALLSGCGGDGGGSGSVSGSATPTGSAPAPAPTPTASTQCSLLDRQTWVAGQLREWYLFPETLPATLSPAPYANVSDYVDALTATARAQRKDRFFTYVTSIAEENAFFGSGASAGFGIRLGYDVAARRVFVIEAFENAPALAAGIDRGTEIVAVGTTANDLRTTDSLIAAGGAEAFSNALGASDPGVSRVLRITDAAGTRNVTLAKADFALTPVSSRYGAKIIDDGGRRVGYLNLRTFISTANTGLRDAFAQFRTAGITQIIVDFRYNGGGLVSVAELMGDLLGGNRSGSEVYSFTTFRPEKSAENETRNFAPQPQSVSPTRIAFIGTGGTASASELVINAFVPYLGSNGALIGSNTFGKPVGQIALDRAACDDRLRVVAFATQNANRQGDYYNGLAAVVPSTCQAGDDVTRQLGDPAEASTRAALDFLAGRSCTRIGTTASAGRTAGTSTREREVLSPIRPTTAQREVPGLF